MNWNVACNQSWLLQATSVIQIESRCRLQSVRAIASDLCNTNWIEMSPAIARTDCRWPLVQKKQIFWKRWLIQFFFMLFKNSKNNFFWIKTHYILGIIIFYLHIWYERNIPIILSQCLIWSLYIYMITKNWDNRGCNDI